MNMKAIVSGFLFAAALFLIGSSESWAVAAASPEKASTAQNAKTGHIEFLFDDQASVKIAKRGTVAANEPCSDVGGETQKGALRYNETSKVMESCDGSIWKPVGVVVQGDTCSDKTVGSTRFNEAIKMVEYCDGANWVPFGATPATAACGAALIGKTRYNMTSSVLEYCNGTDWLPVSKGMKVSVDYPRCTKGLASKPANYYMSYGAPASYSKIVYSCEPGYSVVAIDGNTDNYVMNYVYCCPLLIK